MTLYAIRIKLYLTANCNDQEICGLQSTKSDSGNPVILDESLHISVKCSTCKTHFQLQEIEQHKAECEMIQKYIPTDSLLSGYHSGAANLNDSTAISVKCRHCSQYFPLREISPHETHCVSELSNVNNNPNICKEATNTCKFLKIYSYSYKSYYSLNIHAASASEGNQKPEHIVSRRVVVTAGTHELTIEDIHLISDPNGWLNDKVILPIMSCVQ